MLEQEKDDRGRFTRKSDSDRKIRSIRATDETWNLLGEKAEENDMTRADFLEAIVTNEVNWDDEEKSESDYDFDVDEVGEKLKEILTFKSREGTKMKAIIKEVLEVMGIELDEED